MAKNGKIVDTVVVQKCHKCGEKFLLGYNGVATGKKEKPTCDKCAGVIRVGGVVFGKVH